MKKRGLSTVIAVLLLVLLTIIGVSIIYGVVRNLLDEKIEETSKCGTELLQKVTLNERYTCFYNHVYPPFINGLHGCQSDSVCSLSGEIGKCFIPAGFSSGACILGGCTDCSNGIDYTAECVNSGELNEFCQRTSRYQYVAINLGDVNLEKVIVTLYDETKSKEYEIENKPPIDIFNYAPGPTTFSGAESIDLKLEGKSGRTYVIQPSDLLTPNSKPKGVKITPVVGGIKCSESDEIREIPFCDPIYGFPKIS